MIDKGKGGVHNMLHNYPMHGLFYLANIDIDTKDCHFNFSFERRLAWTMLKKDYLQIVPWPEIDPYATKPPFLPISELIWKNYCWSESSLIQKTTVLLLGYITESIILSLK